MKHPLRLLGLLAAWSAAFAWAQTDTHSGHRPSAETPSAAPKQPQPPGDAARYRSAFSGYRPFTPDEPPKDWRRANDDVREAGGHVGMLKPKEAKP
jgi:hypothetical protein